MADMGLGFVDGMFNSGWDREAPRSYTQLQLLNSPVDQLAMDAVFTGPRAIAQAPEFTPGTTRHKQFEATSSASPDSQQFFSQTSMTSLHEGDHQPTPEFGEYGRPHLEQYFGHSSSTTAAANNSFLQQDLFGMGSGFAHGYSSFLDLTAMPTGLPNWAAGDMSGLGYDGRMVSSGTAFTDFDYGFDMDGGAKNTALDTNNFLGMTTGPGETESVQTHATTNSIFEDTSNGNEEHVPQSPAHVFQSRVAVRKVHIYDKCSTSPTRTPMLTVNKNSSATTTTNNTAKNTKKTTCNLKKKTTAKAIISTVKVSKVKKNSAAPRKARVVKMTRVTRASTATKANSETGTDSDIEQLLPGSLDTKRKLAGPIIKKRELETDEAKKIGEHATITRAAGGRVAISGVLWHAPANDSTIPRTHQEIDENVDLLVAAFLNTNDCKENTTAAAYVNRFGPDAKQWTMTEIRFACTTLVHLMIEIHTNGWSYVILDPTLRDMIQRTMYYLYIDRFEETVKLLKHSKRTCTDIMKGERIYTVIGNPSQINDRTSSNAKSNARKGQNLKDYNAQREAEGLPEVDRLPEDAEDLVDDEEMSDTEEEAPTPAPAPAAKNKKKRTCDDDDEDKAYGGRKKVKASRK